MPIIRSGSYSTVLDPKVRIDTIPKWFKGIYLNWAENILYTGSISDPESRSKLNKEDEKIAIIEAVEGQPFRRPFTWGQLRSRVALFSNALRDHGVGQGDRVAAIMGNSIDTLCVCLAAASLGAMFSTSSTDMGSKGILERLRQIEPKWVFFDDSASYNGKHINLKRKMVEILHGMKDVKGFRGIVSIPKDERSPIDVSGVERLKSLRSYLAESWTKSDEPTFTRVPFDAGFVIVYSSGTTGSPKCIVHGVGGSTVQIWKELHLHRNIGSNSRILQFTTTGWIMYLGAISTLMVGARLM
jgi:acetoacetyl-CoA synthetase